jgi:hypothetical protein
MARDTDFKQNLCADMQGFRMHAAVRGTDERQALEQLCRYITRPVLANDRVETSAAGLGHQLRHQPAPAVQSAHLAMS